MAFTSYNVASININTITSPTKINALRNFINSQWLDIVCLQEVENEQLDLPGYTVLSNVDHARRGTAIALKQHIQYSHVEKSLDGRLIALRVQDTTICNIYAPSGTAYRAAREQFFNGTLAYYLRHRTQHTILAGDFNCVLRPCDSSSPNTSPSLKTAVQQIGLLDVWEKLCPRDTGFTYVNRNAQSRLDRIYVSRGLRDQLRVANTHVCSFTDHKALTLRICLPHLGREHGRGFWSLRPHLLSNENVEEFQLRWQYWTRQRRHYNSWMEWWMTYAKPKIKSFFMWKSKTAADVFRNEHQRLYAELRVAYDGYFQNPTMLPTINRLKAEMLNLQRNFSHTFMRINETFVSGEPISLFHLGERRRKQTIISKLRTEEDNITVAPQEIEQHLVNYFSSLYSEPAPAAAAAEEQNNFGCENSIPPNDAANEACTREITTAEILSAIRASPSRKSPGCDGIPHEFYRRMFDIIHRELNLLMNEALAGNFPSTFVDGIIVLVKKRGGDDSAKSYRPISLLNTDYKLFSRILKNRLESVMKAHRILSDGQKCSNSERNIYQATLALKDRIASLRHRRRPGKLLSFDLDHAFDRVRHSFLFSTMRSIGFNQQFVTLLSQIANRSTSRLLINGHLSRPITIQRSVRQGDPLAMHLFVLYLHPLVYRLEQACGGEDTLVAYADDISVISTSARRIDEMRELFKQFELAAGAKLNMRKTISIDVGFIEGGRINIPWVQTANFVKILGINFANSIRLMTTTNWNALVGKFSQLMWLHSARSLTLHQRIIMLNTFGTSRIWYLSSILPPLAVHTAKLTSSMGAFLWNGLTARIPITQLARSKEEGGLKLQLPALKSKSLAVNRYLTEIESMPFYASLLQQTNPRQPIPIDLPDAKQILASISQIPPLVQQNPTAGGIHRCFIQQTEQPKVERIHPQHNWSRIWKNIADRQISSAHRSLLYLAVNRKVEHRKLWFVLRKADSEYCAHCNNQTVETIEHKFRSCPRVASAWMILQQKIGSALNGWRHLSFEELIRPVLSGINRRSRVRILKLFCEYICHVNESNNRIDVGALNFKLNIIC